MLKVGGLSCVRGPRTLFRDLSFAALPGDIVQVTGPNGSGKTTLLRTLAGLSRADAGTIEWNGGQGSRDTVDTPGTRGGQGTPGTHATQGTQGVPALAHSRAYVGHAAGWSGTLSAADNLILAWQLDGEAAAREPGAVVAALEGMGLVRQRNLPVARLSQGQRKRLHLARLSRSTRPLWLLDEPSSALDDAGQQLLEALLGAHAAAGGIAVVATHHPVAAAGATIRRIELGG